MLRTLFLEGGIVKFTTIVTLKTFDITFKLSRDKGAKRNKSGENLRFCSERESLEKISVIIQKQ